MDESPALALRGKKMGASDGALWAEIEVPAGWGHDRLHPATGPDLDPHLRRIELSTVVRGPRPLPVRSGSRRPRCVRPDGRPRNADDGPAGPSLSRSPSPATPARWCRSAVPSQVDLTRCAHGRGLVPFWLNGLTSTSVFPGWTYRVWALDVEGERLVITAALGSRATPAERAELLRMVETLEFVPPRP